MFKENDVHKIIDSYLYNENKMRLILISFFMMLIASSSLIGGTPHIVTGKTFNHDASVPSNGTITFIAYISSRPGEVQTNNSVGCGYSSGNWYIGAGNFTSAWSVGDVLHVDFSNTVVGGTGTINCTLTSTDPDITPDVILANATVPVELASFFTSVNGLTAELIWSTATEVNNYGFEIEKRVVSDQLTAVSTWQTVGFVQGAGTSNVQHAYSFTDHVTESGTYAYRLKQLDNSGTFKYSQATEVTTEVPKVFTLNQNYPNPFNPATTIVYRLPECVKVTLEVFDEIGRLVKVIFTGIQNEGEYSQSWDGTDNNGIKVSSGVYFYKMKTNSFSCTKKMMFIK